MRCSGDLQPPLANSPVLVHQIDLVPLVQETGLFYVDEIIIADTNVTGNQQILSPPRAYQMPASNFPARGYCFFNEERTGDPPFCLPWL